MLIENELKLFMKSEENNGALLITGKWGCGKSYLVKKCVCDLNAQKEYAIAMISLFGVDSVDSLNTRIRDAYLEFTSNILGKKAQKAYKVLKKVATDGAKIVAAALPNSATASAISMGASSVLSFNPLYLFNVKNTVGQGEGRRKFALVFDDFERCNIDIKNLMGAINDYAENKEIKVIIVADEAKIASETYKEFKEKVVARTLQMSSDYSQIINSIIEKYKTSNKEYKEFLKKSRDYIISAFMDSGYDNLRTLKSCLMDFERIFEGWCQVGVPVDSIANLFYKFCAIMYETKSGHYAATPYGTYHIVTKETDQKKREEAVNTIKAKYQDGAFDYILQSVSSWVVLGEWDDQEFKNELERMYCREEISHEECFILYHFWDLEQSDIDYGMPALVNRAYKGEASRDELITLLQKTHALKTYRISLPCEVDYLKIERGLNERFEKVKKGTIKEPKRRLFTENDQIDKEAIPVYAKIEKMGDRMQAWENRKLLVSYLLGDRIKPQNKLRGLCIEAFDDELYQIFIRSYLSATNGDKAELCQTLLRIDFNNTMYSTAEDLEITLENYGALISSLKKLAEGRDNTIDNVIHRLIIDSIEKHIAEIANSDKKQ